MSEPNTELPQHGAPEGHQEHGHHHDHLVQVTIDGHHKRIKPGEYLVSTLKEVLGVDVSKALDLVVCGEFVPMEDSARICIEGHEVFVSHVRTGGSS